MKLDPRRPAILVVLKLRPTLWLQIHLPKTFRPTNLAGLPSHSQRSVGLRGSRGEKLSDAPATNTWGFFANDCGGEPLWSKLAVARIDRIAQHLKRTVLLLRNKKRVPHFHCCKRVSSPRCPLPERNTFFDCDHAFLQPVGHAVPPRGGVRLLRLPRTDP